MAILISYIVSCFAARLVSINNSGAAVFNMLATSKSGGNICFFDQHNHPGKITSQVPVLIIDYCSRNREREKSYAYVVKRGC